MFKALYPNKERNERVSLALKELWRHKSRTATNVLGYAVAVALIMKVPIASFTWFDPRYLAPVFISGSAEYTLGMHVVSYAGGLVTGLLLLAILALKRDWFKQSLYRWLLGFYMATFGFWQICQGILEGAS